MYNLRLFHQKVETRNQCRRDIIFNILRETVRYDIYFRNEKRKRTSWLNSCQQSHTKYINILTITCLTDAIETIERWNSKMSLSRAIKKTRRELER